MSRRQDRAGSLRAARTFGMAAALLSWLLTRDAPAAEPAATTEDFEHLVVGGGGGALELGLGDGSVHGGGSIFLEWEAIDRWLELEIGVSALAAEGGLELSADLLFKKPFRLSPQAEVMVGAGPEVVRYRGTPNDGSFFGVEAAVDFMFWPYRHAGLWVEPSYELLFRNGLEHSLASTGGVIFGW